MIRIIKILSFLFVILFGKQSFAQPKITCNIYPKEIKVNELASIQFSIENFSDLKFFTPPEFNDVEIVSGPINGGESFSVNGRERKRASIGYIVRAKRAGVYKLENVSCDVDGAVIKCKPAVLTVRKDKHKSHQKLDESQGKQDSGILEDQYIKKGESAEKKINDGMHLRLSVSKNSCYVGEAVVATYKLYTRLNSDCRLIQNPSFNGFSVIDMQEPDVTEKYFEQYNGQKYAVYVIRKSQLYPLLEGRIEIEPASVEGDVEFLKKKDNIIKGYSSFLDDPFFNETVNSKVYLRTDSSIIKVKPLPSGKPEGFNGAVGNFNIHANIAEKIFNSNKGGKLIFSIEGRGNFQMISSPEISWPKGFDVFEPYTRNQLDKLSVPVSGKKNFEYEFNTNADGVFSIPSIHFSYFDPELKKYKTLSTAPITFEVLPSNSNAKKNDYINLVSLTASQSEGTFLNKSGVLLASGGMVLFGLLIFLFYKGRKNKIHPQTPVNDNGNEEWSKIIESRSYNPLHESEECLKLDDCSKFYFTLNNEFKNFLSAKFCVDPDKISTAFVKDCMDKNNICNSTILSVEELLHEIEWKSYTPFVRDEQMDILLVRTKEMVQLINSYDLKGTV